MNLAAAAFKSRSRRWCVYVLGFGFIGCSFFVPFDRLFYEALLPISNSPIGTLWAHASDLVGNGIVLCLLAGMLCFYFPGAGVYSRRRFFLDSIVAFLAAGMLGQIIKFMVGRARPGMGLDPWTLKVLSAQNDFHSFPSGHAVGVFVLALVFSRYLPRYRAVFFFFALIVALGRVVGQSHFLTDIAAGFLIALFSADLVTCRSVFSAGELQPDCHPAKSHP